jgi:hypothetical protein
VGAMHGNAGDGDRLVAAADAALYSAKRDGRDRSVGSNRVAEPDEAPDHRRAAAGRRRAGTLAEGRLIEGVSPGTPGNVKRRGPAPSLHGDRDR